MNAHSVILHFRFLFDQDEDEEEVGKKSRRRRMREKISLDLADVASSYGLVRFQPLVVTDERLIRNVILQVNATFIKHFACEGNFPSRKIFENFL